MMMMMNINDDDDDDDCDSMVYVTNKGFPVSDE